MTLKDDKGKIILKNRELSWLSFNERVLQEANDKSVPLIERIKFLGIFSSNLDEFFRIRVATLRKFVKFDKNALVGGQPAINILFDIHKRVLEQQRRFLRIFSGINKELGSHHIHIINEFQLNAEQAEYVKQVFQKKILATLFPLMIDKIPHFPYLKDKSTYLAVKLSKSDHPKKFKYALLEVPSDDLSRFYSLPSKDGKHYIILLEDIIRFCLHDIFYILNYDKYESWIIKLTRDAELDIDFDYSGSFIEKMSHSLKLRKKGVPVRFIYDKKIPDHFLSYLIKRIHLDKHDLIPGGRYHNFKDFINFPNPGKQELENISPEPLPHHKLKLHKSIIKVSAKNDCLIHLPYHSFDFILQFLREAAIDPKVSSIKITLYRVAKNSNIVKALINAARNGKKITVIFELQARFDEEANIYWSTKLEEEGVKVIYGMQGMKVHTKMCLISRTEKNKTVLYANLGTGNYHEGTAKLYCDHSLFTSDKKITSEISQVFDYLEHKKAPEEFKYLLVSPFNMRKNILHLIRRETKHAQENKEAFIILKLNHIVDSEVIKELYEAAKAGVKIQIIARTTCTLIPELAELKGNISVISIVDKFLEHARMYVFCNKGNTKVYLSSADMMTRNLDHRVEIAFPVLQESLKAELLDILKIQLADNTKARIIDDEQTNRYKKTNSRKKVRAQVDIYNYLKDKTKKS